MATPVDSANLILKLYELRREPVMREARNFFLTFNPSSVEEYMGAMMGPNGGHVRMVVSYWEMASSFVVAGAIDPHLFDSSAGEHILVYGKIEPLLPQLREAMVNPNLFKNLETVCTSAPSSIERVRTTRERIRAMMAGRQAAAGQK